MVLTVEFKDLSSQFHINIKSGAFLEWVSVSDTTRDTKDVKVRSFAFCYNGNIIYGEGYYGS